MEAKWPRGSYLDLHRLTVPHSRCFGFNRWLTPSPVHSCQPFQIFRNYYYIRKSKIQISEWWILFPNNVNLTFFFFLCVCVFYLCSIDTVYPPAAINIHTHSLILCYSAWTAGCNSLPIPVHVLHFLQFQGAGPPPEPSPIQSRDERMEKPFFVCVWKCAQIYASRGRNRREEKEGENSEGADR